MTSSPGARTVGKGSPERFVILDGMRGYFLVFMLLNHLSFQGSYMLVKINHAELSFVQDAPGFVFLSGLLIGMVYTRRMAEKGLATAGPIMWRRALELFAYAAGCLAAVLILMRIIPNAASAWQPWLEGLVGGGYAYLAAALTLLYQPTYMDILPQYIVYLTAAPPLLWLCVKGKWHWVAALSGLLWFAVQIGLHLPLANTMNAGLGAAQDGLAMRGHFNLMAWQIVFMAGMVLGTLAIQGKLDLDRLFNPHRRFPFTIAVAVLTFFLALKLSLTAQILPEDILQRLAPYDNRPEFGAIYLLNFAAMAYAVGWLIVAGKQTRNGTLRSLSAALTWIFQLRFLRLLGRHSLQVYAYHVVLVYVLAAFDRQMGPLPEGQKTMIAIAGIASLALPALLMEWRARVKRVDSETNRATIPFSPRPST
ncbi:OpgC domain-containing protein [Iodidimonas sp. SYSU 1G8]|uniref:OpgC family protein n=1 Tax=Iodidimonas sp. SYSU 1G8 TaxID=3133967 RepID=UPI0031FEF16A